MGRYEEDARGEFVADIVLFPIGECYQAVYGLLGGILGAYIEGLCPGFMNICYVIVRPLCNVPRTTLSCLGGKVEVRVLR